MRFLFECMGRCMSIKSSTSNSATVEPTSPSTPRTEKTRSLVTPASNSRRKKRNSAKPAGPDWRPSLFAISEDNAVQVPPKKVSVVGPSATSAQRSGVNVRRVNARPQSRDFGHDPLPMVVPAFSAAPFMF